MTSNKLQTMVCSICGHRKARRDCPALGKSICSVCCGTKRLVEINCPDTCVHLSAARANPAAAVKRQHDADVAKLLPSIQPLTERQQQLFFLFQSVIARHQPDGFARLIDSDVADAAASVAATLETAARGVLYEHATHSTVAQKLARELTALLQQLKDEGATVYDREAAITLRAIEQGATMVGPLTATRDDYVALVGRLLQINRGTSPQAPAASASPIILP